jgi:uncharacterized protein YdcH (DUF465 family)
MSHPANDLHSEFPADADILHQLKLADRHFKMLSERYDQINDEIYRIEAALEAASDERLEGLKKERLRLLDEIAGIISTTKAATA